MPPAGDEHAEFEFELYWYCILLYATAEYIDVSKFRLYSICIQSTVNVWSLEYKFMAIARRRTCRHMV